MLTKNRTRLAFTVCGISVAFFLTAAQVGLFIGWSSTNSAIVQHAGADLWVMARQNPAFDYGSPIARSTVYVTRSTPGIIWAEGMFMSWNVWQRPDGRRVNVEVIGLDDSCAGGPWEMVAGDVHAVHQSETVIIDNLYADQLGIVDLGDEVEMFGTRARVGGLAKGIRTFTAAPFVFTSIKSGIKYDQRYRPDEITYVLAKCVAGASVGDVKAAVAAGLPEYEVLTTQDLIRRTVGYWMLGTGAGVTVLITAILGLCIGTIIISQTLFAITQDHLAEYSSFWL